jgi:hypothetical protein
LRHISPFCLSFKASCKQTDFGVCTITRPGDLFVPQQNRIHMKSTGPAQLRASRGRGF